MDGAALQKPGTQRRVSLRDTLMVVVELCQLKVEISLMVVEKVDSWTVEWTLDSD